MSRGIVSVVGLLGLALEFGCAATAVTRQGAAVELVKDKPGSNCQYLDEAVGSQGNWATGDYTSDANLMMGARNDLRNRAAAMGGNVVWLQHDQATGTRMNIGMSNATVIGKVYRCTSQGL